jgi:hypothetical protein
MAWGGYGLRKVSFGPCERTTPETALWPFQGWPTHRLLTVFYPFGHTMLYAHGKGEMFRIFRVTLVSLLTLESVAFQRLPPSPSFTL